MKGSRITVLSCDLSQRTQNKKIAKDKFEGILFLLYIALICGIAILHVALLSECYFSTANIHDKQRNQDHPIVTSSHHVLTPVINHFTTFLYRLEYHVGDSSRTEQRSESGEVSGTYTFVAPEGDEYEFKYEADEDGFKVEGDALPEAPEETDEVKAAREAFFEAYEKQLELAGDYEYESAEYDNDDEESSEEESSEEDSGEESDEEDDEEEEEEEENQVGRGRFSSRPPSRIPQPPITVPYPYSRRS